MTKENCFEKIQEMIAETAGLDKEEVRPDSNMVYDIGLNSMEMLGLLSTIENAFSIHIPEKVLRTFVTLQDIVDYVSAESGEKA